MLKHRHALAMASAMLGLALVGSIASVSAQDRVRSKEGEKPVPAKEAQPKGEEKPAGEEKVAKVNVDLSGTVVGADGKPVEGISVSPVWSKTDDTMSSGSGGRFLATTDAEGKYSMSMMSAILKNQAVPMIAISADGKQMGYALAPKTDEADDLGGLNITLQAGVEVKAVIKTEDGKDGAAIFSVIEKDGTHRLFASSGKDGAMNAFLPVGKYSVSFTSKERGFKNQTRDIEIKADSKLLDLGAVTLEGSVFATGAGKPAPELSVTHVRNTEIKTLAGFKGKWVLLDFWGVW